MIKVLLTMAVFVMTITAAAQDTAEMKVEAKLCTGIEDRMPVGEATSFAKDVEKVYLWTKVTGVTEGEAVIHHVWLKDGVEMADVSLPVKGSPWRTYSYKTIPPEWAGSWEVKVTGADGNVITSLAFTVGDTPTKDQ
jgi:hypothetical protein